MTSSSNNSGKPPQGPPAPPKPAAAPASAHRPAAPPKVIAPPPPPAAAATGAPKIAPVVPPVKPAAGPPKVIAPPVAPSVAKAVAPVAAAVTPATAPPVAPLIPKVSPVAKAAPLRPPPAAKVAPAVPSVAPAVAAATGAPKRAPPPPARAAAPPPPPPASDGTLAPELLADLEVRTTALDGLDYFELLKVDTSAGMADIKRAFYRESRMYHPDRFYHLTDPALKARVNELYKRVTEAYYVLRDDVKRAKYLADIHGPERASKLRFTEASEVETKVAVKKQQEEQIGTHPKGRQFYQSGMSDFEAERWSAAERNFKMAVTYEPANAKYKEMLAQVQKKLNDEQKKTGGNSFLIK